MMMQRSQVLKPDLAPDQKELLAIERRRRLEEERKSRIFNAKHRTMGVDTAALDQQIALKRAQQEAEKQRESMFADYQTKVVKTLTILEQEQERQRRQHLREIQEFREAEQQKYQRREWDLNDPEQLKREMPARFSDEDERLGASSMQVFDGEDLDAKQRKEIQAAQLREWVSQQIKEKELRKLSEKEFNELLVAREKEINARVAELQLEQERSRKDITQATAEFNLAQAEARRQIEQQKREEAEADALEEIRTQLESDLLTENRMTTQNAFNPHRVVPYHFKGLSLEQRQAILDEQARQTQELAEKRERQRREEEEWAVREQRVQRELLLQERRTQRERQAMLQALSAEHKAQAAEHKQRERFLNKEVYANEVRPEYFDQFNTSSR